MAGERENSSDVFSNWASIAFFFQICFLLIPPSVWGDGVSSLSPGLSTNQVTESDRDNFHKSNNSSNYSTECMFLTHSIVLLRLNICFFLFFSYLIISEPGCRLKMSNCFFRQIQSNIKRVIVHPWIDILLNCLFKFCRQNSHCFPQNL